MGMHCFAFTGVLAAPLCAQAVWNVPAGSDLQVAFAQATPGDILLLAHGTYLPFHLTKGVCIVGTSGTSIVDTTGTSGRYNSTFTIPAGQRARIVGLSFDQTPAAFGAAGHTVGVNGTGDVAFEECAFGPPTASYSFWVSGGNLLLHHCQIRGGTSANGGMGVSGTAIVSMTDCTLHGGDSHVSPAGWPSRGLPGLNMTSGQVSASRCTFVGGDGAAIVGLWVEPPVAGVAMFGTSRLFLTDSSVFGGNGAQLPGAVALSGPAAPAFAHVARTVLTGGSGTATAPSSMGNVITVPELVGIGIDRSLQRGQTSTVTAIGGSSQQLLALVAGFDSAVSTHPLVVEPVYGNPAHLAMLGLGAPPNGGTLAATMGVPNVAGIVGVDVWFQALQLDSALFHSSAAVGGIVR